MQSIADWFGVLLQESELPSVYKPPKGCPCTPQVLCDADQEAAFNEW